MQFKTLLPAAALAWTASGLAFTEMSEAEENTLKTMEPFLENANIGNAPINVRLPCNGCAVAQNEDKDGVRAWDEAGDKVTDIALEFKMAQDAILLGGEAIYPPSMVMNAVPVAKQVKSAAVPGDFVITDDDLALSTHVEMGPAKPVGEHAYTQDVKVEILGIEDKVVHAGTIAFSVLAMKDGDLRPVMSAPQIIPTVTTLADAQCTTIMCRVKAQIAAKVEAMKAAMSKVKTGCMRMMGMHGGHKHGNHPHHHPAAPQEPEQQQQQQQQQQQPEDQPEHPQDSTNVVDRLRGGPKKFAGKFGKTPCPKHAFARKFMHGIRVFIHHILMPVLVGVAAGMAVSALGMVLGQLFFMVWMRIRGRRSNGGYIAIYQVVDQEGDVEQGEDEQLPKYEPADEAMPPAYTDEKTAAEN